MNIKFVFHHLNITTEENYIFETTPGMFSHLSNKKREGKAQVID